MAEQVASLDLVTAVKIINSMLNLITENFAVRERNAQLEAVLNEYLKAEKEGEADGE